VIALLLALALQQGAPAKPVATASVDRGDVAAGDLVTLTLRVEASGNLPVEIGEPILSGLERRGFREQSQVSIQGGVASRVTTRQIQLLAERAGTGTIGPIRVRQGSETVETAPLSVQIVQRAAVAATSALSPRARALVTDMPPPEGIESVALGIIAAPGTVMVGTQVDVIVAAWFPREVRLQLRTPPTLTGPAFQGAWVYPQPGPAGIAASRIVNGRWYDLFVTHDVVFPLAPGRLEIGRARVSYALPITYSFLTRELRHEVQSEPLAVMVTGQPAAGRLATANGMVASGLRLALEATPRNMALGDASTVTVTLSGRGNVALWPEPEISWPIDVRVYPGDVEQAIRSEGGVILGSKQFDYLFVPDSAGLHTIRGARVAYFDADARRYATAQAGPVEIVAGEGAAVAAAQEPGPPLLDGTEPGLGAREVPPEGLALLFALPPLFALLARFTPRLRRLFSRREPDGPDTLVSAHRRFRLALERLVPAADQREGDQLDDALRAAGVEQTVAAHATRVRDRLRHATYGAGGASDPEELTAETNEVVKALVGGRGGNGRWLRLGLLLLLLPAGAQGQTAERLYEAGAFRAAADSFAARSRVVPLVAAHWFNLGSARYRSGELTGARAAWVRAARLDPREPAVDAALRLVPAPDPLTRTLVPVEPFTPTEAWIAAAAFWLLGWLMVAARRTWRQAAVPLVLALVTGGWAARTAQRYHRPVALVRRANTPLRSAPYASASSRRTVSDGFAVLVTRTNGAWLLVERGGEIGWLLASEVVRI